MATPIKRKRTPTARKASADAPTRARPSRAVTKDDIARRAFEIYCARGCEEGHDLEDWLQAERDLRGVPPPKTVV